MIYENKKKNRLLDRNSNFKEINIRYYEWARTAATNDIELQANFHLGFANLIWKNVKLNSPYAYKLGSAHARMDLEFYGIYSV